jgi:hypothetical protein
VIVCLIVAASCALASLPALLAARCNWRRYRASSRRSPLHGLDLSTVDDWREDHPSTWEAPDAIAEPLRALAFARLADNRVVAHTLVGELVVLAAGAALGSSIVTALWNSTAQWASVVALSAGAFGVALRMRATRVWAAHRDRYERRYEELAD